MIGSDDSFHSKMRSLEKINILGSKLGEFFWWYLPHDLNDFTIFTPIFFLEMDDFFWNPLWKTGVLTHFDVSFCGLRGNAPWLASSNVGGIDVCHILEKNDIDSPKNRRGSQILKNSLLEH